MSGTFPPSVEGQLKRPHEILARQNRVLFVPHDALAVIHSAGFQDGWIVAKIGVTAPNIEGTPRQQDSRHAAEPSKEHLVERFFRYKVIRQRPVLSTQLLGCGLGFFWMAFHVEFLMMLGASKRTEASSDGVV